VNVRVYVPPGKQLIVAGREIARGSGIVGGTPANGYVVIDYEGNLHGAVNLVTWRDRVEIAAGRHVERYPTVARAAAKEEQLVDVGLFDTETRAISLWPFEGRALTLARELVAGWLDLDELPTSELQLP
jgi:hypothetical protein